MPTPRPTDLLPSRVTEPQVVGPIAHASGRWPFGEATALRRTPPHGATAWKRLKGGQRRVRQQVTVQYDRQG